MSMVGGNKKLLLFCYMHAPTEDKSD